MKTPYWLLFFLPLLLLSCAGPPTLSKSTVTDSLTLSASGSSSATGVGTFYDYSQPSTVYSPGVTSITSYTPYAISFPGGPFTFTDMTHDTLGFSITITSGTTPVTFTYQLDGISGSGVANPIFTSGRISF